MRGGVVGGEIRLGKVMRGMGQVVTAKTGESRCGVAVNQQYAASVGVAGCVGTNTRGNRAQKNQTRTKVARTRYIARNQAAPA